MQPDAEYERLLQALKDEGYRVTGPRRALLRLLAERREPLSIQEMCAAVNRGLNTADGVNLGTVYRFANLLVEMGLARRIEFGEGYYRYEREEPADGPHHHHLVCRRCGRVEDFQGCDIAPLAARCLAESGFQVERHQLELYGTCATCRVSGAGG